MFSFSFKESQEREARKVDVFDFGKWFYASCKGNKIYHRGLLQGVEWKYCLFVTKDCLEDCFSLISLKPMSHCFHYKDFNVPVSFGKGLHLFWNKSKAPQMYCLLSSPAHKSCASGSHCRGVRRMFILQVMSQVSQGVCMGPAPWQQRTARTWNVGTFGQHSCTAVQGRGSSQPGGTRDPAQVVLCCTGALQGCCCMRRSQGEQMKPNRSLHPGGSSGLHGEGRTLGPVLSMKAE